ncbi:hypothetical protein MARA_03020 (plasmid) [Mycolicibacterium arabiense]|uniref:Uncharacterized protein n=1 Tax=Mycolicibacterium arabiense TaxID=1286181 RepID=A0A7I7RQN8_9MYCO|nr:hypothetical protein MARA_03020 [Mycolicibacterium arabiense]
MLTTQPTPQRGMGGDVAAPYDSPTAEIVRVLVAPRRRRQSECTCGWRGRRRVLRSLSVLDALDHAARAGCHPGVPLVDVDIGRRP